MVLFLHYRSPVLRLFSFLYPIHHVEVSVSPSALFCLFLFMLLCSTSWLIFYPLLLHFLAHVALFTNLAHLFSLVSPLFGSCCSVRHIGSSFLSCFSTFWLMLLCSPSWLIFSILLLNFLAHVALFAILAYLFSLASPFSGSCCSFRHLGLSFLSCFSIFWLMLLCSPYWLMLLCSPSWLIFSLLLLHFSLMLLCSPSWLVFSLLLRHFLAHVALFSILARFFSLASPLFTSLSNFVLLTVVWLKCFLNIKDVYGRFHVFSFCVYGMNVKNVR